jgi:hypothetical protein
MRRPARALFALGLLLTASSCIDDPVSSSEDTPGTSEVVLVWDTFDQLYPTFGASGLDWDGIGEEYASRAEAVSDRPAMIALLVEMLAHLQSRNVVVDGIETCSPEIEPNYDIDVLWTYLEPAGFQWVDGWGECLLDSVPYLLISDWDSLGLIGVLDDFLGQHAGAPALIIDVRMCGDLTGSVAVFPNSFPRRIAQRFNSEARLGCYAAMRNGPEHDDLLMVPMTIKEFAEPWESPVIILCGEGSAWLTELFLCMAAEIPTVTILGDTTQGQVDGTYSLEEWFSLPGGEVYRLPLSTILLADSATFVQGSGLPPDILVPATPEDFAGGIDPVLEYALGLASGGSSREPQTDEVR